MLKLLLFHMKSGGFSERAIVVPISYLDTKNRKIESRLEKKGIYPLNELKEVIVTSQSNME